VRYLAVLSQAFTMAVREWLWCDDNPVRKITKPKEPRGRVRYLSDEERQHLLNACQESRNPYLYTVVPLALATGARRGELLSLRWQAVDLKRCVMTFHETKNGETRSVPVSGYALAVLTQHAKVRRLDTALVFPDSTGRRPLSIRDDLREVISRIRLCLLSMSEPQKPGFKFTRADAVCILLEKGWQSTGASKREGNA
jgi:integrase